MKRNNRRVKHHSHHEIELFIIDESFHRVSIVNGSLMENVSDQSIEAILKQKLSESDFLLAAACPQFVQREFSFTLENDVYRRYLSFSNHMEFEKELMKLCPEKIDIGAVYSAKVVSFIRLFNRKPFFL